MKSEITSKIGLSFILSILMFSTITFAQGFANIVETLKEVGVFEFYLPFLLVFAVLYALLLKAGIFGTQKQLVTIIALAASAFIMVYVPVGITFGQFLTNFVGNAVTAILTVLLFLIFIGMLQSGKILPESMADVFKGSVLWIVLIFILLIAFGVFISSGGTSIFPGLKIFPTQSFGGVGGLEPSTIAIIVLIIGTAIIIFLFAKGDKAAAAKT